MKKLRLDLDALSVESFEPLAHRAHRGTAHGAEGNTAEMCTIGGTCFSCSGCPTQHTTCQVPTDTGPIEPVSWTCNCDALGDGASIDALTCDGLSACGTCDSDVWTCTGWCLSENRRCV